MLNEVGRYYFDSGIAAFGSAVGARVEQVSTSSNAAIAKTQRIREFERLMGGDMSDSAAGFADVGGGDFSPNARVIGEPRNEDDEIELD